LEGDFLNAGHEIASILRVGFGWPSHRPVKPWNGLFVRVPSPRQFVIILDELVGGTEGVRHKQVLPLFVRAKPVPLFDRDVDARAPHVQTGGLEHPALISPDVVDFSLGELILGEQSDDPGEELSLVGIVQVVGVIVGVVVALNAQLDVRNVGHCSDFACRLIEEHLPCVLYHQLPIDLVESFPQLRQHVRKLLFPDLAQGEGSPEHLAVVQSWNSAQEIMGWIDSFGCDCYPRQKTSETRIFGVERFQSLGLLLD
jgi:hypothetical protein